MQRVQAVSAVLLFLSLCSVSLHAQDQQRLIEEERRKEMDERAKANADLHQDFLWDAGGWLHLEYDYLNDQPTRGSRKDWYYDLRLWGQIVIDRTYTFYARLRTDYIDFNAGDQFPGDAENHLRLFAPDQIWFAADWTRDGQGFSVRAGQEFITMGTGLLYNDLAYAAEMTFTADPWAFRLWAGHSIIHEDDIDQSIQKPSQSRRGFLGIEADVMVTGNHRAYAMVMIELDFNSDNDPLQDWKYNAQYFGIGGRGTIVAGWGYSVEGILEIGRTADALSTIHSSIRSYGLSVATDYQFPGPLEPALRFQYLYGSGDPDRGNVAAQSAGNTPGTLDRGFLPFGFVQTGYSLFPRVSNIHIFRLGGSFRPLEDSELFHKFEVGLYGYYYRKAQSLEPISDPRSNLNSSDVGTELDFLLRWRILSDLGLSVNYGCFLPGRAYADRSARHFVSAGVTYSF